LRFSGRQYPPETSRDELDYAYNETGLRQLATACGPDATEAVEGP
jgi:hypothetical protein